MNCGNERSKNMLISLTFPRVREKMMAAATLCFIIRSFPVYQPERLVPGLSRLWTVHLCTSLITQMENLHFSFVTVVKTRLQLLKRGAGEASYTGVGDAIT